MRIVAFATGTNLPVCIVVVATLFNDRINHGTNDSHNSEEDQIDETTQKPGSQLKVMISDEEGLHHRIHLPLDLASLTRSCARVQDNLRVCTAKENNTDTPTRVPHDGAT